MPERIHGKRIRQASLNNKLLGVRFFRRGPCNRHNRVCRTRVDRPERDQKGLARIGDEDLHGIRESLMAFQSHRTNAVVDVLRPDYGVGHRIMKGRATRVRCLQSIRNMPEGIRRKGIRRPRQHIEANGMALLRCTPRDRNEAVCRLCGKRIQMDNERESGVRNEDLDRIRKDLVAIQPNRPHAVVCVHGALNGITRHIVDRHST